MRFLGIDPGKTGGLALMSQEGAIIDLQAMPELPEAIIFLKGIRGSKDLFVFIEKAQAMPLNGVVSMFNYGHHAGYLEGSLSALQIPYELVPPASWAKVMHSGLKKKISRIKDRSYFAAQQLFPGEDLSNPLVGKASNGIRRTWHEGIVDALLICEYGRRKYTGQVPASNLTCQRELDAGILMARLA